jgi:hypothetical protein
VGLLKLPGAEQKTLTATTRITFANQSSIEVKHWCPLSSPNFRGKATLARRRP